MIDRVKGYLQRELAILSMYRRRWFIIQTFAFGLYIAVLWGNRNLLPKDLEITTWLGLVLGGVFGSALAAAIHVSMWYEILPPNKRINFLEDSSAYGTVDSHE